MRTIATALLFLLAIGWTLPESAMAQTNVRMPSQQAVTGAVDKVRDAVVQIETIGGMDQVGGVRVTNHPRTGLIVNSDGYIVTAAFNLAHQPNTVIVRFPDGQRLPAEVVAENHSRQITLLKVASQQSLASIDFVSRDQLAVGQTAIAVGRSLDLQQVNLSTGIISATNRIWGKAIQTDAAISPHNFGGPLIDLGGNVMGVLVPMSPQGTSVTDGTEWYDSGIGFAVPLDELNLAAMVQGIEQHSGRLGVTFKEQLGYASPPVIAVSPGNSPGGLAGLKPGDRITQIDQMPVQRVHQVRHQLGARYAGEKITIDYQRGDQALRAEVELVEKIEPWTRPMLGVILRQVDDGLQVAQTLVDGPAEKAGVKTGDRLVQAGQLTLEGSVEQMLSALNDQLITMEVDATVDLVVQRDGKRVELQLQLQPMSASPVEVFKMLNAEPSELVEIKVAEHSNVCQAYFPKSAEPSGLLMWLGEPGERDAEKELSEWQAWCDATNTALLLPQSLDKKSWAPDEVEFLNKVAQQAVEIGNIDPERIAVGGRGTGGTMASLVAMSGRKTWRGLILVDAVPSGRIDSVISEPGYRQLILMLNESDKEKRMDEKTQQLRRNGFAVHFQKAGEDVQQLIANWVATINRL